MASRRDFKAAAATSSRQVGASHQESVDLARALAALANGPHDERLAAAHVAGGEYLRDRGRVATGTVGGRLDVAARVLRHPELVDHSFVHGMHIAQGEQ